ncbi:MAG: Clp protease N-terminal domain-containing protein [Candidatus Sericytochromatia bacterium]
MKLLLFLYLKYMFEKFSESAIKTIMHSREEARRLEFSSVHPEHLFLGILYDKVSVSSLVLNKLGIDLKKARRFVEKILGRGYTNIPLEQISFNMNVMEVISNAVKVAYENGKEIVLTEHILISLLKIEDKNIDKILLQLTVDKDEIETEIKILCREDEINSLETSSNILPEHYSPKYLTSLAKAVLEDARLETIKQGHIFIGTEQLLLSLTKDKFDCLPGKLLKKQNITEKSFRIEIHRLIGKGSGSKNNLLQYTSMLEKSLEYAWLEAKRFKYAKLGTSHLLLGITTIDNSTSSYMLKYMNLDPEQLKWEVSTILKKYPEIPEPDLSYEQIEVDILPNTNIINENNELEEF